MNTTQANRLLNVAFALRQAAENNLSFDMSLYCDPGCGTPQCALGHYAAREDLQDAFVLRKAETPFAGVRYDICDSQRILDYDDDPVLEHFGIDYEEASELFDGFGCGNADTPTAAADYIEDFVRNKGFDVK